MRTYDAETVSQTGVFLESELDRRDPTLYEPIVGVTWQRDIDLREDVVVTDESASFDKVEYGAAGSQGNGKSWAAKNDTSAASASVQQSRTTQPLHLWAEDADWTIIELAQAQTLGRPIDDQKFSAVKLKFQLDADEMVYAGDQMKGATGLINSAAIPAFGLEADWATATPTAILADVNGFLAAYLARTGQVMAPTQLLLPPDRFSALCRPISDAGTISILSWIAQECVAAKKNARPLEILDLKWLEGAGVGGLDRAVAYRREKDKVRWSHVPLQRTEVQNVRLWQRVTYYCRLGEVEFVQPETILYGDFAEG